MTTLKKKIVENPSLQKVNFANAQILIKDTVIVKYRLQETEHMKRSQ